MREESQARRVKRKEPGQARSKNIPPEKVESKTRRRARKATSAQESKAGTASRKRAKAKRERRERFKKRPSLALREEPQEQEVEE